MRIVAIVVTLSILAIPSQAQWDVLMVSGDMAGTNCGAMGSGFMPFYVVHKVRGGGARGSRFRMVFPDCLNAPAILGFSSHHDFVGDPQSGITFDYGECETTPQLVMTVNLLFSGPADDCCYIYLLPHPESSSRKAEAFDCDMNPFDVPAHELIVNETFDSGCFCSLHCNHMLPWPENPNPPDGATDGEVDPILTWDSVDPATVPSEHVVYFGADPNPPLVRDWYLDYTYDPGPLLPGKTYYWKIGVRTYCGAAVSNGPVWQFTTRSDVPVEATTWGRIKSLYRGVD